MVDWGFLLIVHAFTYFRPDGCYVNNGCREANYSYAEISFARRNYAGEGSVVLSFNTKITAKLSVKAFGPSWEADVAKLQYLLVLFDSL